MKIRKIGDGERGVLREVLPGQLVPGDLVRIAFYEKKIEYALHLGEKRFWILRTKRMIEVQPHTYILSRYYLESRL